MPHQMFGPNMMQNPQQFMDMNMGGMQPNMMNPYFQQQQYPNMMMYQNNNLMDPNMINMNQVHSDNNKNHQI